jgi:hypothetical protein
MEIDVTSWYERCLAQQIPGSDSDRLGELFGLYPNIGTVTLSGGGPVFRWQ